LVLGVDVREWMHGLIVKVASSEAKVFL